MRFSYDSGSNKDNIELIWPISVHLWGSTFDAISIVNFFLISQNIFYKFVPHILPSSITYQFYFNSPHGYLFLNYTHASLIRSFCLAPMTAALLGEMTGPNTHFFPTSVISPRFEVWKTMESLKGKAYILWPKNTSNLFRVFLFIGN